MKNRATKKLFTCLLMLTTLFAWAQERGSISGKITLNDNTPAANINVGLKGSSYSTVSNDQGYYEIKNIKPDTYTLRISAVGIMTVEKEITVKAGETSNQDVVLSESAEQLKEVIIEGEKNRYKKQESSTASRMPLKSLENAQVYNVVTKELIADQLITNQDDALKNVPGLYQLWGSTGRAGDGGSYFASRGFVTQAQLRNGIAGTVIANNDVANIETIEAIKGPSATLFGSILTSYGGLINRVTKKPFATFGGEVSYQTGSYGFNRATVDVNTPLNTERTALFRLNAATAKSETFQDYGMNKSFFVAPSFTYIFSDRLSATLEAEFFSQDATGLHLIYLDYTQTPSSIGINNAEDLDYNFKRSLLGSDFITKTRSRNIFGTVNYKISDSWASQSIITSANNEANGPGVWFYLRPGNEMSRNAWGFSGSSNAIEFQQNFSGDFKIGNMRNRVVIGGDIYYTKGYTNITYLPGGGWEYDVVNYSGDIANYNDFNQNTIQDLLNSSTSVNTSRTNFTSHSVYINDVLNLTSRLIVSAGIRFDNFENKGNYNAATDTTTGAYSQNAWSPKFGLVYQVVQDEVSVFANYQNSFKNQLNPNAGTSDPSLNGETFKPERANQFEAGIKLNALKNKLGATVSYYNIKVKDVVRSVGFNNSVQDGSQKSTGFEAEITANPIPGLNIIAGYAYNDSKLEKASADVEGLRPTTAGPKNLANFWVSYRFPAETIDGLGVGFGGNYGSESPIYNSNVLDAGGNATGNVEKFVLPSYTVFNASLFYDKPKYRIALKVNNLTDELYFNGYTTINVQAPRTFMGSLTYKF
ncbi:TonB-dependent receptor [Flavobacterium sp. MK4S-17]|uniref:TonB-dependent receptor n=1 Tax=Flavobacterium sp. MK4S-17 TaxID=2543737 RepID=UPI001357552C|nr:TonB-dependent receptor [Flavobacterium sp. MK4S-17]